MDVFKCEDCPAVFSLRQKLLIRHRCDAVSVRKDARKKKNARQGERVPKRRRHSKDILEPYRPDIVEDDLEGEAVDNIILLLEEDGVREIYRNHWTSLRTHYREGPNHSHCTFRWDSQTEPSWEQWLRRSSYQHGDELHLLLVHGCHFSYISDIDAVAHAFGCEKCGKQYKERKKLIWHEKRCAGDEIKRYYPGGVYHPNPTPLEVLADEGVPVETDFVYPFRDTYDFECYFTKTDIPTTSTVKTPYTVRHVPLSVSVCSNVPGFENPKCLISDGYPQSLVDRMGNYLEEISTSAFQILRDTCFKDAFEYLETLREEDDKGRVNLKTTLLKYLSQLPVVGFNSGKYDLNVIKPYFAQRFLISEVDNCESDSECGNSLRQWGKRFVIKKNNEFMAISTPFLKFWTSQTS
ncbi:Zinc finger protein 546-like [Plakobranchus ocellatus]|uniref:Zinc finger protein 546-like n=1 Tax=Plakobranchus ocellatus TaxID=259542 RepID=A0AAV3YS75_9GAST|nr:Zinc finger protein 546-like [Plakobranchus ocellatus]